MKMDCLDLTRRKPHEWRQPFTRPDPPSNIAVVIDEMGRGVFHWDRNEAARNCPSEPSVVTIANNLAAIEERAIYKALREGIRRSSMFVNCSQWVELHEFTLSSSRAEVAL